MFLNQRGVSKGSTMVVPELPPFRAWEKPIQNRDEMGLGVRLCSLWQGAPSQQKN